MRNDLASLIAVAVIFAAGCSTQTRVDLATEESAIRATDARWLAASKAHDIERTVPFWSDDATIIGPGAPLVVGKDAIHKYVSGAFATPGFSISWTTEKVDVAKAGDIAYSSGTDTISVTGPDGKTITQRNHGMAIWKKQADGSWKCVVDVMTPVEAAGAK
ncbi:MAG TPA: SgcJ/EcaC family oxidoreductase [Candidatus Acidoferrum sp.]|jgi:uncharacterized protein (TIGR02246 family)